MANTSGQAAPRVASETSESRRVIGTIGVGTSVASSPSTNTSDNSSISIQATQKRNGAAGDQAPTKKMLSCEELVNLHTRLLDEEHDAELRDRVRLNVLPAYQLQGLLVTESRKLTRKIHEWVLKSPSGLDGKFPKERERVHVKLGHTELSAVVRKRDASEVTLIVDQGGSLQKQQHADLRMLHDDSTYSWMRAALQSLPALRSGPAGCLRATLFAEPDCPLEPPDSQLPPQLLDDSGNLKLFNRSLNPAQLEAVEFTLRQRRLAVIHGPAGTGKTTTAVEVILQHVERGQRVLACAQSNSAVDNLLRNLHAAGLEDMVRLGHPARIDEDLLEFWIDEQVQDLQENWEDRFEDWTEEPDEGYLRRKVIEDADVVLSTLATANARGPLKLTESGGMFDLLVVDEASQALEAECWLAIPRTKKLLLFGDPKQLSPVVKTRTAKEGGLSVSLMERQMELHGDAVTRRLQVQYRMHGLIQEWSAGRHYGGLLSPDASVLQHRLSQLPGVRSVADTDPTLLLIDTAACRLTESRPELTRSWANVGEADLVAAHAAALAAAGVRQEDMGVVTPYNAQTAVIRTALQRRQLPNIEVNTVGGFQGREKEAILLSLVRSNDRGDVGFIGDRQRVNTAVTRARRQLCIVCDSHTVSVNEELASLLAHLRQKGEARTASAYKGQLSPEALQMFRKGD